MPFDLQPGVGLSVCLTFRACMCHCVHLSLQCYTDFHLFDLQCHNIWTPGPDWSHTHPEANNLSWNTVRRVMTPDLQTHTLTHLINTRHVHQTFLQGKSFPVNNMNVSTVSFLNCWLIWCVSLENWSSVCCVIGQIIFHATFTQLGCFSEQNWTAPNWFTH